MSLENPSQPSEEQQPHPSEESKRKIPVSRILGVKPKIEQSLLGNLDRDFFNHPLKKEGYENDHTEEFDKILGEINSYMLEFFTSYGIVAVPILPSHVHIFDRQKLSPKLFDLLKVDGKYQDGRYLSGGIMHILILEEYDENLKLNFYRTLAHEMIHANSFQSFQKSKFDSTKVNFSFTVRDEAGNIPEVINLEQRRTGFAIIYDLNKRYFRNFNEAITEELNIRFDKKYLHKIPELEEQIKKREEARQQDPESGEEISAAHISRTRHIEGNATIDITTSQRNFSAYPNERKDLNVLIDLLYEANQNDFESREDIFKLFVKAAFEGKLLAVARLIEKTFGKGSFREFGEEGIPTNISKDKE
jgi:hypothetical protein